LKSTKLLYDLCELIQTGSKFRSTSNSQMLQKKFNKILTNWLNDVKNRTIHRQPDNNKWQVISLSYSFIQFLIVTEIIKILNLAKSKKYLPPAKFSRFLVLNLIYNYIQMNYYQAHARFKLKLSETNLGEISKEVNRNVAESKKLVQIFWRFHMDWQIKYNNYLRNIVKRTNQANVHEHVKITTNPVILKGMRGSKSSGKLILGNNGSQPIVLYPHLAFPSTHWSLIVPEAQTLNDLYNLKRLQIPPKHTIEMPITVFFPRTLSFSKYSAILKLNPKPIRFLPEIF